MDKTSGGSGREYITVFSASSASGVKLPPYNASISITLGVRVDQQMLFAASGSGWMEQANFFSWFEKIFVPAVSHLLSTGPVVLFVDSHNSHVSLDLINSARSHGIHLFCFPSHTTGVLQPLDVGVYGPLKTQ